MSSLDRDRQTLEEIFKLILDREHYYATGVQTTLICEVDSNWRNVLTKFDFVNTSDCPPEPFVYEYENTRVCKRLISIQKAREILGKLLGENSLGTGTTPASVSLEARFSSRGKNRLYRVGSKWPGEVFIIEPRDQSSYNWPSSESLISLDAPYYPSVQQVVADHFGFKPESSSNYLRGGVILVLPDFRARISKLIIALGYLKVDLECNFVKPSDLVLKVYGEGAAGSLVQETIYPKEPAVEVDLDDKPASVSLALLKRSNGEVLDEIKFDEEKSWRDPEVILQTSAQEIEQMLLRGEGERLDFKQDLNHLKPERFAKIVVAFANTKGGTIVFGVNDDHDVVGCRKKGLADTVTNIIRDHCDPPPRIETQKIDYEGKELFLVRVMESQGIIHVVKGKGPFIRADATNRSPTSRELENLQRRRYPHAMMPR